MRRSSRPGEADAADTLTALVVGLGGQAVTAYNGSDGLRKFAEEFRPDVVLLDIGMPEMDGYETCRLLRAQPYGQVDRRGCDRFRPAPRSGACAERWL